MRNANDHNYPSYEPNVLKDHVLHYMTKNKVLKSAKYNQCSINSCLFSITKPYESSLFDKAISSETPRLYMSLMCTQQSFLASNSIEFKTVDIGGVRYVLQLLHMNARGDCGIRSVIRHCIVTNSMPLSEE